jgi:hypothetical protein
MSLVMFHHTRESMYIASGWSRSLQERDNGTFVTERWPNAFPGFGGAGPLFVAAG